MQGAMGDVFGIRLIGSYGVKSGYFMFLKKR